MMVTYRKGSIVSKLITKPSPQYRTNPIPIIVPTGITFRAILNPIKKKTTSRRRNIFYLGKI